VLQSPRSRSYPLKSQYRASLGHCLGTVAIPHVRTCGDPRTSSVYKKPSVPIVTHVKLEEGGVVRIHELAVVPCLALGSKVERDGRKHAAGGGLGWHFSSCGVKRLMESCEVVVMKCRLCTRVPKSRFGWPTFMVPWCTLTTWCMYT
jgi:hypothetical protein